MTGEQVGRTKAPAITKRDELGKLRRITDVQIARTPSEKLRDLWLDFWDEAVPVVLAAKISGFVIVLPESETPLSASIRFVAFGVFFVVAFARLNRFHAERRESMSVFGVLVS